MGMLRYDGKHHSPFDIRSEIAKNVQSSFGCIVKVVSSYGSTHSSCRATCHQNVGYYPRALGCFVFMCCFSLSALKPCQPSRSRLYSQPVMPQNIFSPPCWLLMCRTRSDFRTKCCPHSWHELSLGLWITGVNDKSWEMVAAA